MQSIYIEAWILETLKGRFLLEQDELSQANIQRSHHLKQNKFSDNGILK